MQAFSLLLVASYALSSCFAAASISCTRLLGDDALIDKVREGRLDILSTCLADTSYRVANPLLLYHACTTGHISMLRMLIQDPEYIENVLDDGHFNAGNFALGLALQNGHAKLARYLLFLYDQDLIELDVTFNSNQFALSASANGLLEFLEDLLEYEDVNPDDRNGAPLVQAIMNGHTEVALLLLEDPRVCVSRSHNTALATAVQVKNKLLVSILLEKYEVRADCMSAMFVAALNGDVEILEMFLNNERIEFSRGAITHAFVSANSSGQIETVKCLLFDLRLNRNLLRLIAADSPESFLGSEYGQFLISCVVGDYKKADELCPAEIHPVDLERLKEYNPFILEFLENRNFI